MSQLFPVLLQILLVVGRMTLGAKDVSPFDPDAKNFNCCMNNTKNLWEPTCVGNDFGKCVDEGWRSCVYVVQLGLTGPRIQKPMCVPSQPQLECMKEEPSGDSILQAATCTCAEGDSFDKCNPLKFLQTAAFKIPFCPVPPGSNPYCLGAARSADLKSHPEDPYCRYEVTKIGSGQFTFQLNRTFCRVDVGDFFVKVTAKLQQNDNWPNTCVQRGAGSDKFECKCVGVNCIERNLTKTLTEDEIPVAEEPTSPTPVENTPETENETPASPETTDNPPQTDSKTQPPAKESITTVPPAAADTGLSDGEIAGIVVGVIIFLAIVCAALIYLRRKPKSPEIVASPPPTVDEEKLVEGIKAEESEDEDEEEIEGEDDNEAEHEKTD